MVGLAFTATTSCSGPDDEITSLTFNRNFAPLQLEASNVKETTANISWNTSAGATSYNLEVFADDSLSFEGSPVQTLTGITADQIPYTLENLLFDTKYSVRVQAVTEGNDSRTSNWNGAYFKTGTKQFLNNPKPAQIADRSVVLTWEVEDGFDVSNIVVGNINHQITDEEKQAGQAIVDGLTPETAYDVYLYYNGKQCGNRSFTTIADLEGAIIVRSGDDLTSIITEAQAGAVLAVFPGTYVLNPTEITDEASGEVTDIKAGAVKVNNTITIKGVYPTDQPVIKGRLELYDGAGLSLSQLKIDGLDNATGDQIFNYKTADANYGALDIQNCEIYGMSTCKGILYLNVKAIVESITINNSIVHGIECSGGDFIDSRAGLPRKITLTNSTFYQCATSRDFIRVDDKSADFEGQAGPQILVDHCTLYNVGSGGANYRIMYPRFAGNKITFTNNIVVGTNHKRGFANQKSTDMEPTLANNYYFNCENLTEPGATADASITWFDTEGIVGDPGFADPANADFTLSPDGAAFKGAAGDPRWRK